MIVLLWAVIKLLFLIFRAIQITGEQGCQFLNRVTPPLPYSLVAVSHGSPDFDSLRMDVKQAFLAGSLPDTPQAVTREQPLVTQDRREESRSELVSTENQQTRMQEQTPAVRSPSSWSSFPACR